MKKAVVFFETLLLILGLCLVRCTLPPSYAHSSPNSRQIIVKWDSTGNPIPGAEVKILDLSSKELIERRWTDSRGVASFLNIPHGLYLIVIQKDGHVFENTGIFIQEGKKQFTWRVN